MNMFLDSVPESLWIAGTEYKINPDYRVWIKFQLMLMDDDEDSETLFDKILNLVFADERPPESAYEETTEQIMWFYRCGKEIPKSSKSQEEVFSYEHDDGYLAAAFRQQYQIDLDTIQLHWWKFYAYLLSLSDRTEFVKIMTYRAVDINSKMSPEQKQFYQKMKKHYKLPTQRKVSERDLALEQALINGEPIDDLL